MVFSTIVAAAVSANPPVVILEYDDSAINSRQLPPWNGVEYESTIHGGNCCDPVCSADWRCEEPGCIDRWLPRSTVPLPFLKEMAEARGATLPLPLGVSVVNTQLERKIGVGDIRIGLGGAPPEKAERFSVANSTASSSTTIGRLDAWLLPCLNVYGIAGHTRSETTVQATVDGFPTPGSPSITLPIDVVLNGSTYGGGVTAAVGAGDYFALLDVTYTKTDFDSLASELSALVIAPRFGRKLDGRWYKGEVHIGVMYQDTAQTVNVVLDQPVLGEIQVAIDQYEPDPWNFLIGTLWAIDERLHLVVEGGFGGRKYLISGAILRF